MRKSTRSSTVSTGPDSGKLSQERDPLGFNQHDAGAKLDDGKLKAALVMDAFARALERVCLVGTVGAVKYTEGGWEKVPEGIKRYKNAAKRHDLKGAYERFDKELSARAGEPVEHLAAKIWNDLAVFELQLRKQEEERAQSPQAFVVKVEIDPAYSVVDLADRDGFIKRAVGAIKRFGSAVSARTTRRPHGRPVRRKPRAAKKHLSH